MPLWAWAVQIHIALVGVTLHVLLDKGRLMYVVPPKTQALAMPWARHVILENQLSWQRPMTVAKESYDYGSGRGLRNS